MRDADQTRRSLLDSAFAEIYRHGFQAASVAKILKNTRVTKGAFFHHFPTKKRLGYAVVDEVIAEMIRQQWVVPLGRSDDPLQTILDGFAAGIDVLAQAPENLGCPLNNLAQEMSPLDAGFRRRTQQVFASWIESFATAIKRGQMRGQVSRAVDAREVAVYLVSQIEGLLSLAKNSQDLEVLRVGWRNMKAYLDGLRRPKKMGAARRGV